MSEKSASPVQTICANGPIVLDETVLRTLGAARSAEKVDIRMIQQPGGSTWNTLKTASHLCVKVRLIGLTGDDEAAAVAEELVKCDFPDAVCLSILERIFDTRHQTRSLCSSSAWNATKYERADMAGGFSHRDYRVLNADFPPAEIGVEISLVASGSRAIHSRSARFHHRSGTKVGATSCVGHRSAGTRGR